MDRRLKTEILAAPDLRWQQMIEVSTRSFSRGKTRNKTADGGYGVYNANLQNRVRSGSYKCKNLQCYNNGYTNKKNGGRTIRTGKADDDSHQGAGTLGPIAATRSKGDSYQQHSMVSSDSNAWGLY